MTGPDPAVAAARTAVRAALADLTPGTRVVVACSGGADSLALAAATAFVAPRAGLLAGSVTVDHGLLPGSAEVARRAADACAGLGLAPALIRAVTVPAAGGGGPEAAARSARYAALEAAAEEGGAAVVLLGHTLDDQAETVLLGLARGSGARSLAGMAPRRGRLRRPLLDLRRADTERVCRALGLEFARDPGNAAAGPWRAADGGPLRRAAVREGALPALERALGPGVPEALARTADLLRDDADLLDALAAEVLDRARLAPGSGGELVLDAATLAGAPPALRRRALRTAAADAGSPAGALGAVHSAALDALVVAYRGQGPVMLPGGVTARRACGRLTLARGTPAGATAERDGDARGRQRHGP